MRISHHVCQPLCGDCALLFFSGSPVAEWMPTLDQNVTMSNHNDISDTLVQDLAHMLDEPGAHQLASQAGLRALLRPPERQSTSVFDEIPRNDITYRSMTDTLVPHPLVPDMFLFKYLTFAGATAYQPCATDIDHRRFFTALRPLEVEGNRDFKIARGWSCIIQSMHGLPKDVRWVLATVYNLSCQMLQPGVDKNELSDMKHWLMHWYDVVDRLFYKFRIYASAPLGDQFLRPTLVNQDAALYTDTSSVYTRYFAGSSEASSTGTVIYGDPLALVRHGAHVSQEVESDATPVVHDWLQTQPETQAQNSYHFFDSTPRHAASRGLRRSISDSGPLRPRPVASHFDSSSDQGASGRSINRWLRYGSIGEQSTESHEQGHRSGYESSSMESLSWCPDVTPKQRERLGNFSFEDASAEESVLLN